MAMNVSNTPAALPDAATQDGGLPSTSVLDQVNAKEQTPGAPSGKPASKEGAQVDAQSGKPMLALNVKDILAKGATPSEVLALITGNVSVQIEPDSGDASTAAAAFTELAGALPETPPSDSDAAAAFDTTSLAKFALPLPGGLPPSTAKLVTALQAFLKGDGKTADLKTSTGCRR